MTERDEFWLKAERGYLRRMRVPVRQGEFGEVVAVSAALVAELLTALGWAKEPDETHETAPLAAEQDSRGATGHHDDTGAQRGDSAKGDA